MNWSWAVGTMALRESAAVDEHRRDDDRRRGETIKMTRLLWHYAFCAIKMSVPLSCVCFHEIIVTRLLSENRNVIQC